MKLRNTLLVVDDMGSSRNFLRKLFEEHYDLLEAENGAQALRLIQQHRGKLAAVLLDLIMPVMDGYQVLLAMEKKGYLAEIPVIVITSDSSRKSEARSLELGASDLIAKPYDPYIVRRRVQNIVELHHNRRQLASRVDELSKVMNMTNDSIVNTLATITEFRSLESGQHILRIRNFTRILLEDVAHSFPEYELDEQKIASISSAAVLHDIGKISVSDAILNKPGKLTAEEFDAMKAHTTAGCQILEGMTGVVDREYMRYAYNICRYHHERWDGRGYPDGLKGDNIPICAQVVALADVYDALTTKRVYKDALPHERSVNMILNGECGVFNPRLLECFKNVRAGFAACAKAYADGIITTAEDIHIPLPAPAAISGGLSTQQMSTIKYHTLLNYVGGIVAEVDVDQGTYHLIYDSSDAFPALRYGDSYEAAIFNLIGESVHPDDRERAWKFHAFFMKAFFEEGLRKCSRCFRVRGGEAEDYFICECSLLRLDMGNPNLHKAIVVWKRVSAKGRLSDRKFVPAQVESGPGQELLGSVVCCRNDKALTVMEGLDRLAAMLGYTEEELRRDFHGSLTELILPEDLEVARTHANKQMDHGHIVEVEFRLQAKDGRPVWVLDKCRLVEGEDGMEYIYHAMVDNTKAREAQEELRQVLERHQILLGQIDEIIMEWNVESDTISFSPNFEKLFGYMPPTEGLADAIMEGRARIHPEDVADLQVQIQQIRSNQHYPSYLGAEFRVMKEDGSYLWCRLRGTAQQKENGKIDSIVGLLTNIDADKRSMQALQDKAMRDSLTNLLNKAAARQQIEEYMAQRQSGERAALLVLDMDNFKMVNDRYGHLAGDSVLIHTANMLGRYFRGGDIVARVGGDEFMVLIKSVPTQEMVEKRCAHIMKIFASKVASQTPDCHLSCSIGVALAPEDGTTFQELFQRADRALLQAKSKGKNCYVFYDLNERALADYSAVNTRIESDDLPGIANQSLVYYAFKLLYESGNVEETIQSVMETVGRQMNVSRVYIFENTPDNRACRNTFEWCNKGISPEIENLQLLSYETDAPGWEDNYDENGIFYCKDISVLPESHRAILEPQGIKSMLQCAIRDGGVFRGFVGFDECAINRMWTQEQIDVLTMIAELTAVFLLKKRAQDGSERWGRSLKNILDHQDSWIYVIDPDTCEIFFINAKAADFVPHAKPGAFCYQVIRNQEHRCEDCPAGNIRTEKHACAEVYYEHLDMRVRAEANMTTWDDRDAVLVVCDELED